jgi:hypothetical protein
VVDAFGAIYVIGGAGHGDTVFQDVWVSTDGGARPDSVGLVGGYSVGTHKSTTGLLQGYYMG